MTINNQNYSSPRNINLKGGILRFNTTQSSNPLGDLSYGLYVDSSGNLIYRTLTTSVTLGATGGGSSAPSLDAIYAGDKTLAITAGTLTLAGTHASNDVLTITGTGSGDLIQLTNAGSGNDIEGTSDTWHFSATGDMTANKVVFAGDDGADSITLTVGDIAVSDGSLTIVDADNAATLSVTNNSATSESVFVFAGSGAYTGDTTKAFMTITPSGLTTGEAVYLPLAAITTGKGLYVISGTTLTSGALVTIESGAGTAITNTTGALLEVKSGDTAGTNAVLVGMSTAATDETVLLKLLASDALALGNVLNITAGSMTTGSGIVIADLAALTTGQGISILSSATAITTTGRLFISSATGATSTSGILNEFIMTQTDETILLQLTNATAGQVDGCLLNVVQSGVTTHFTGAGSAVARFTGSHTTGSASTVSIVSVNTTAGNALLVTSGATTTNGRAIKVTADSLTTGVGIGFAHATSVILDGGSMMRLSDSGVATGGATSGTILDILSTGSVVGTLVKIYSNVASQTATTALEVKQAGATLTAYTDSFVKITGAHSGNSSTGQTLLVTSANTTAGNAVKIDAAAITTGTGLLVTSAGVVITTGELVSLVANAATTCTGVLRISATALTDGFVAELTGGGTAITSSGGILNLAMGAATAGTAIKIITSGIYTGTTGLIGITATETTTGTIIDISNAGRTTGDVLKITTNTTGTGNYINCYDGAATDFKISRYGAVTIAGNAEGTAALTVSAGDLVLTSGDANLGKKLILSGIQTVAAGGTTTALDLTKTMHSVDADAGGDIFTLADGIIGQIVTVTCVSATGIATVTPANLAGGTSVTLNAEGESVTFQFIDTQWYIIGGNAYTVI